LYTNELRVYSVRATGLGNILSFAPTAANTSKVLTKLTFNATETKYAQPIKIMVGNTSSTMTEVVGQAFSGTVYTYTNNDGFKYFSLTNAYEGGSSNLQIRLSSISFDYRDDITAYDPVASLTTNFTATQFAIGEEYTFSPTILPAGANQSFVVSSLSPAIQVTGSKIKVIGVATSVVVTITTVGKNASDQTISQDVTFNTFQATTTVAEALTLTPDGKIVYLVENALVSDGYNTQYDRQIQLVDTVEPTKNILIFKYGINPLNSYRYIAGGTISFKATLGIYSGVNQFTDPIIISYSDDVETFATSILAGDVEGQCETRFAGYKTTVLGFDTAESAKLQNGTDANIVSAKARYEAWAAHLGENPYTDGSSGSLAETTSNNNSLPFAIIVSILGLTVVAGLYLQRSKRKEEND
ncbi:MAG TPA: hypothetical protein PLJ97_03225, partial [Candidatus Saccharibacteria bacterium]|nr:hypothetical protein [Candidatus Saccharibacteria bacterium]